MAVVGDIFYSFSSIYPAGYAEMSRPGSGVQSTILMLESNSHFSRCRTFDFGWKYESLFDLNAFAMEVAFDFLFGRIRFPTGNCDFPVVTFWFDHSLKYGRLSRASDRSNFFPLSLNYDPAALVRLKTFGCISKRVV